MSVPLARSMVLPRRLELLLDPYKGSVLTFRRQEVGGSYSRTLPNEVQLFANTGQAAQLLPVDQLYCT